MLHTWPLASGLGTWSRMDNADTALNAWIVAWVAHQLPVAPLALFDANIFYPEPRTLAFSEHMTVQRHLRPSSSRCPRPARNGAVSA